MGDHYELSDAQLEAIAERTKNKVLGELYGQIGKGVASKLLWVIGAALVSAAVSLSAKAWFNP